MKSCLRFTRNRKQLQNECAIYTLPVVDGYIWSKPGKMAVLQFKAIRDGKKLWDDATPGKLHILWPLKSVDATLKIKLDEPQIKIIAAGNDSINWYLDWDAGDSIQLPF